MTQRIFDRENEKDMADLWDIVPEEIKTIYKDANGFPVYYINTPEIDGVIPCLVGLFKINWHDKTEITRPIQEATGKDVYKLCCFWDSEYNPNAKIVGCLSAILPFSNVKYVARGGLNYKHCRRLTKQEIEELC